MDNNVSLDYIDNAINELSKLIGVNKPIDDSKHYSQIKKGEIKNAIKSIAQALRLPIEINLAYVSEDYDPQAQGNKFQSTDIAKVHDHGSGGESIIAQVVIPRDLPFFGSQKLNGFQIDVKMTENAHNYAPAFVLIMAHELSHILLYSLQHKHKENEFYTDLAAMMNGFHEVFKEGRKKITKDTNHFTKIETTSTVTYGYLNDEQFEFAYNKICSLLNDGISQTKSLSKQINGIEMLLMKQSQTIYKHRKFIEFITQNKNMKISGADAKIISGYFQSGYLENIISPIKHIKGEIIKYKKYVNNLSQFNSVGMNEIKQCIDSNKTFKKELLDFINSIKSDIKILKKYVSIKYKFQIFIYLLRLRIKALITGKKILMK